MFLTIVLFVLCFLDYKASATETNKALQQKISAVETNGEITNAVDSQESYQAVKKRKTRESTIYNNRWLSIQPDIKRSFERNFERSLHGYQESLRSNPVIRTYSPRIIPLMSSPVYESYTLAADYPESNHQFPTGFSPSEIGKPGNIEPFTMAKPDSSKNTTVAISQSESLLPKPPIEDVILEEKSTNGNNNNNYNKYIPGDINPRYKYITIPVRPTQPPIEDQIVSPNTDQNIRTNPSADAAQGKKTETTANQKKNVHLRFLPLIDEKGRHVPTIDENTIYFSIENTPESKKNKTSSVKIKKNTAHTKKKNIKKILNKKIAKPKTQSSNESPKLSTKKTDFVNLDVEFVPLKPETNEEKSTDINDGRIYLSVEKSPDESENLKNETLVMPKEGTGINIHPVYPEDSSSNVPKKIMSKTPKKSFAKTGKNKNLAYPVENLHHSPLFDISAEIESLLNPSNKPKDKRYFVNDDMEGISDEDDDDDSDETEYEVPPVSTNKKKTSTRNQNNLNLFIHPDSGENESFEQELPNDCAEIKKTQKFARDGVYTIFPTLTDSQIYVYCDMTTDNGGWTVFQRRGSYGKKTNFYRRWRDYKLGFGDIQREFWLGNDIIHALSENEPQTLRIDLEDFSGEKKYAVYTDFYLGNENKRYQLEVSRYQGNAGDSLSYHNKRAFSTKDKGVSACARKHKGAWWYRNEGECHRSNLNGIYLKGRHATKGDGINWKTFMGYYYSMKISEMKIRPRAF